MDEGAIEGLQGRISAHRRVLVFLISLLSEAQRQRLRATLLEPYPPQDGQEDPGAVPVSQFAGMAAYAAELRLIFEEQV
jgi:hypothetical protein